MAATSPRKDQPHPTVHEAPTSKVREQAPREQHDADVALHKPGSPLQAVIEADSVTKEIVVKMVDAATGEVVRQIPPEEMLRIARAISGKLSAEQQKTGH